MPGGYHRLSAKVMEERDKIIIHLVGKGFRHKVIAHQVRMEPSGLETRLQKLRLDGKLPIAGGCNE